MEVNAELVSPAHCWPICCLETCWDSQPYWVRILLLSFFHVTCQDLSTSYIIKKKLCISTLVAITMSPLLYYVFSVSF